MARTISTSLVPIPNASAPNAPCVLVWRVAAHDGHPRLGQAELRTDDVDDALAGVADAVERDAELGAVRLELVDLREGHRVEERQAAIRRRDRVVGGGHGLARSANAEAAGAQAGERLRAGDLVDEVEVDREDGRRARILGHDMVGPDLLDDRARGRGGHRASVPERPLMVPGRQRSGPEAAPGDRVRVGCDPIWCSVPAQAGVRARPRRLVRRRGYDGRRDAHGCHLSPAARVRAMVASRETAISKREILDFTTVYLEWSVGQVRWPSRDRVCLEVVHQDANIAPARNGDRTRTRGPCSGSPVSGTPVGSVRRGTAQAIGHAGSPRADAPAGATVPRPCIAATTAIAAPTPMSTSPMLKMLAIGSQAGIANTSVSGQRRTPSS